MEKYLETLPAELICKIFLYTSHPVADLIRPYIKSYNQLSKWESRRFNNLSFPDFMIVNALYIDLSSIEHQICLNRIWNN